MSQPVSLASLAELLNTDDLAELFQVETRTIHRWIHTGEVPPPIKLGRCTRWRKSTIERFLTDREQAAAK